MARLEDVVCLVTGASRGIGKGIALGLGKHGATVYITGRTLKPKGNEVGGSLEETAAEINLNGGKAIPVIVDHKKEKEIQELFDRIRREQNGRLDILVNNAYSAVPFLSKEYGKTFYEIESCSPGEAWDQVNDVGLRNNYICSTLATRMMLDYREQVVTTRPGLIINVSSFGSKAYAFSVTYGCGKAAIDRMSRDMAIELGRRKANVCVISLWPGFVRTEEIMSRLPKMTGPRRTAYADRSFSESTELSGFAVAALASESPSSLMARSGDIVLVSDICIQHSLRESDGHAPPDYRSLQLLLQLANYRFSWIVPSFIRLPKSVFMWILGLIKP